MKTSNLFSLDWNDILKGLLMAVGTPVVVQIEQTIDKGSLTFNWHLLGMAAIGGLVAYLGKNFFTPATVKRAPSK